MGNIEQPKEHEEWESTSTERWDASGCCTPSASQLRGIKLIMAMSLRRTGYQEGHHDLADHVQTCARFSLGSSP